MTLIEQAKALLAWKQQHLNHSADLNINMLKDFFATEFIVRANERTYPANHQNYLEFLNEFRSNIKSLHHAVERYLPSGQIVVMPMQATIETIDGKIEKFQAVKLFEYNEAGKIILWQEVASQIKS